ncbi:HNH endonuclease [Rhodococcus sp. IEGM 1318]|uniref:HNH endonuclease n=1 Tax=Rhodococcus sp. IEGM 1318 TaxID=3082226 RepID=UPI00398926FE
MSDSWWLKDARWVAIRKWYKDNTPAGGWTCHLCKEPINPNVSGRTRFGLSIDHIVPVSRGGALFDLANTAPAHGKCNSGKREGRNLVATVAAPYQAPFRRRARRAPGTTPKAKAVTTQPIFVEPVGPDDVTGSQIW